MGVGAREVPEPRWTGPSRTLHRCVAVPGEVEADAVGEQMAGDPGQPCRGLDERRGAADVRVTDLQGRAVPVQTLDVLGHLLGGAGAVETIFCILAIRDQVVPPTLNLDNPDEGTEGVDLVPKVARKRKVRAALNNSFGFGGTNASVIVKAIED